MKWVMALALAAVASGQQLDLSALDRVGERAKSKVNVTLNEDQLKFAGAFLSSEDRDQEMAKGLINGLKSINVRVFEFDQAGAYSSSDMDGIRSQLRGPGWSKLVEAREGDEMAEVYMFTKDKQMGGIAVIAGERRELVVVNIVGPIDLKSLGSLGGKFGIPKDVMGGMMPSAPKQVAPRKPAPPKQDD
ncbi:MAG TPA: DUF4252 domain-containing protein [Bryobacteraceae bacterium]|nr:DUF4252 domain-containing protein [Bryobacteraceae bacterium]